MNRVRYGYAAAALIVDYYEYNVRICLALLYPTQALVHILQEDKLFVHLDDRTLRHFDVLDTSKLKDAPDSEA